MKAGLILSTCVFTALECTLSNIHERENINDQNLESASKVWRGLVQPKAELLMWFVIYGRLNTKNHLQRLNILRGDNYGCVLCNAELETISTCSLCVISHGKCGVPVVSGGELNG